MSWPALLARCTCTLGMAALMTHCTAAAAPARKGPPVLFVPGFKGSVLQDAQGELAWLTGAQALGLATPELSLPLTWNDQVQARDPLHATEPLGRVRVVPWLWERAIYGPWLERAQAMGYPFETFAYDWRRDNAEAVAQLKQAMRALANKHRSKVRVVAHSMGGLITLALMHEHPELFHDVVFAGVPFKGGIGILPDLHIGAEVGLNRRILTPEVAGTFASIYCLFGEDGTGLVDRLGNPLPVRWFDVATWHTHGFGSLASMRPASDSDAPASFANHLAHALTQAQSFRTRLTPRSMPYPPILAIIGNTRPTLVTVMQNGPKSHRGWDFETSPKEPGDGRVGEHYATPPAPIPYEVLHTDAEHSEILNDARVAEALAAWFAKADAHESDDYNGAGSR